MWNKIKEWLLVAGLTSLVLVSLPLIVVLALFMRPMLMGALAVGGVVSLFKSS
jgi:hypothetical protein